MKIAGTLRRLIDHYDAWVKPAEAAKWRAEMAVLKRDMGIMERAEARVRPPGPVFNEVER